jgi:glycosyltransferase involved in cell wall biosynthesis
MRILFFVHSLRRGGAERVLLEVARGLSAKAHEVEILSWLDVDEYREETYRSLPRAFLMRSTEYRWPWSVPQAAASFRRVVERFRPDAVELHTPNVAWVAAWAGLRTPCVHVLHGYGAIMRRSSAKDQVVRSFDRLAQRRLQADFIVVTPPMADVAADHFSVARHRFACVPNGVDLCRFRPQDAPRSQAPTILMLGTLSPNKGQSLGLRAFPAVLRVLPGARLLIVGEGAARSDLESQAREAGLADVVAFLGRREDVPSLMAWASLLWQLSDSEGLPMVALEAMACGVPVVGFDVRGTRTVVVHGETGYLVPYGDTRAVAEKTLDLLRDEVRHQQFAINGRQRMELHFSIDSMVSGHERLLCEAAQRGRAHG